MKVRLIGPPTPQCDRHGFHSLATEECRLGGCAIKFVWFDTRNGSIEVFPMVGIRI